MSASGHDMNGAPRPTEDDNRRTIDAIVEKIPFRSSRGILAATILLFLVSWIVQPETLGSSAMSGMIPFAAILAVIALGQTLVIQQGGIDLSVPGVVSLSGIIVAYYSSHQPGLGDANLLTAVLWALGVAAVAGLVSGLLVSKAQVAPIVATIGMNAVLYGVNLQISGGTPVQVPESLSTFVDYKIFGVTTLAYLAVAITIVVMLIIKKTVFGRRFEAVGANAQATRAAGVVAGRYQLAAYVGAAVLYAIGGIFLAGIISLPSAFQGDIYLIPSIAAVVLGGTSLFGGSGNLVATVIAAVFLTQLQQLVLTTGASAGVQFLFQGGAIIVGVAVYSLKLNELTELLKMLIRRNPASEATGSSSS
ncbi:MAG: ABC transporter permease [Bauldia sp.]|nr:ABC transporter permease [Bauldia sp.]